jgi:hypothetical protein
MSGKRKGQIKKSYMILIRKPGMKRPLGRPRPRWKDKVTLDFKVT